MRMRAGKKNLMLIFATKAVEWCDHQQRFPKTASLVYFSYANE